MQARVYKGGYQRIAARTPRSWRTPPDQVGDLVAGVLRLISVPILTDGVGPDSQAEYRTYSLEDVDPGLFLEFAQLKMEGIVEFANQYGPLTSGTKFMIPGPSQPGPRIPVLGERVDDWAEWIAHMNFVTSLWPDHMNLASEDLDGFKRKFAELPLRRTTSRYPTQELRALLSAELERLLEADIPPANWSQEAVTTIINANLYGRQLHLRLEQSPGRPDLQPVAHDLVSQLWLQAAEWVSGQLLLSQCPQCLRHFRNAPEGTRARRDFCSPACTTRAYRDRIAKALELLAQGHSIQQTAEIVGSTPRIVKGWKERSEQEKAEGRSSTGTS